LLPLGVDNIIYERKNQGINIEQVTEKVNYLKNAVNIYKLTVIHLYLPAK